MVTKTRATTDWDGERFLVDFAYSDGGAAGLAVRRADGWHWYDPCLAPILSSGVVDDPIEAAINSLIARREYTDNRPMSEAARAAYALALRDDPMPTPVGPSCHYCGQPIDPRNVVVGVFKEYQCEQCR